MKKLKFTEEQIAYALRQIESGTPQADVCRQLNVSEARFYIWKKKYAHLGVTELRKLRVLEDENARLKKVVAGLSLDKNILTEALRRKSLRPTQRRDLRLYRLDGLQSRMRVRRRKHIALHRGPAPTPVGPSERWSMDSVHDALATAGLFVCSPS